MKTRIVSKPRRGRSQIYAWDKPTFVVRVRPKSPVKTNRTVLSLQRKLSTIAGQRKLAKGESWKTRSTRSSVIVTRVG